MLDDLVDDEKWLHEQQMLHNIQSNYCREFMDSIQLQFVFLDTNKHITHITSMREPLHLDDASNQCLLKEDRIIALLSNIKKQYPSKKFTLHHISSFLVDLEPEHIQLFSNSDCSEQSPFLQHYSIVQSICIPPSIFIFHNVNTLYFFLHEIPCSHQHTLKSILKKKNTNQSSGSSNKTKRVRIQHADDGEDRQEVVLRDVTRHRKTRRQTP
jgi:hypothetical protein